MTWERAQAMTDTELESVLFRDCGRNVAATRAVINYSHVHEELHRHGVTLQLLWSEYLDRVAACGDGTKPYQYSQFCELYGAWRSRLQPSMRMVHRAGEKAFVDYSGKKPKLWDRVTGEAREVELFVMVLGASSYTYAEATLTQRLPDFVGSTIRGFEFFNGVPEVLVPDQLRSAVRGPDRYEPDINATYLEMAQHYGVVVLPARPRRPKDKAKVEVGVQVVQRWILARLRNRTFFELDELNQAIWELLDELNVRPFQSSRATESRPSRPSTNPHCGRCRRCATNSRSARRGGSTSTTMSSTTVTTTACPMTGYTRRWRSARRRRWWRSSRLASGSRRIVAATIAAEACRPIPPTVLRTTDIRSGPPSA